MPTHYHDAGIAPRTNSYAYGTERKKRMPYNSKGQAKAVLANTDPNNPRHAEARMHAKAKLQKKPRKRKNGLAPGHKMMGM